MTHAALDTAERRRMIDFATRWMPYGGGPAEDIVVEFGISPREYFTRLHELLERSSLDHETTVALRAVCRRRLWLDE